MNIETLRAKAKELGIAIDGRWKEAKLKAAIENATPIPESYDEPEEVEAKPDADRIEQMNAYAVRLKASQSPDMPVAESRERIKIGLEGQGWGDILEHLSLPNV